MKGEKTYEDYCSHRAGYSASGGLQFRTRGRRQWPGTRLLAKSLSGSMKGENR